MITPEATIQPEQTDKKQPPTMPKRTARGLLGVLASATVVGGIVGHYLSNDSQVASRQESTEAIAGLGRCLDVVGANLDPSTHVAVVSVSALGEQGLKDCGISVSTKFYGKHGGEAVDEVVQLPSVASLEAARLATQADADAEVSELQNDLMTGAGVAVGFVVGAAGIALGLNGLERMRAHQ